MGSWKTSPMPGAADFVQAFFGSGQQFLALESRASRDARIPGDQAQHAEQHLAFAGAGLPHDGQRFTGGQVQIHFRNGADNAFTGGKIHTQLARLEQGASVISALFRVEHVAQPVAKIV